jgi:hypothetical protein
LLLIYSGYEDFRKRKITTVPFLVLNVFLFFYYLFSNFWISLFLVPVISEFFAGRFSFAFYLILVVSIILEPSALTISISYSLVLIKLFGVIIKNFGRGDVKVLQSIAVAFPVYVHIPLIDSLFPPVMFVILIASILGTFASYIYTPKKANSIRGFSPGPTQKLSETEKFWVEGSRRVYKIPFVTFIAVGYSVLFILSSLRLV